MPNDTLPGSLDALTRLRGALDQHRDGDLPATELAQALRDERNLLASLPPRYTEVLEDLLARLESGALFSEESCSFSQRDLTDALEVWLTRAREQVQGSGAKTG